MQNKGLLVIFGALVAVAILGASYVFSIGEGSSSKSQTPTQTSSSNPSPSTAAAVEPTGEVLELEVSGEEFSFNPARLTVNKGEAVKLTFKNEGKVPHDLAIDELGVMTSVIGAGKQETVEFTANKTGRFKMYCNVGNHRASGMEGDVEIK